MVDRKKSGGGMIEVVDGVLQFLEDMLLALTLTRYIGDRPDGHARGGLVVADRPNSKPQPTRRRAFHSGDADLFFELSALPCCLQEAVDRLRRVGIADKRSLDRPHVIGVPRRW